MICSPLDEFKKLDLPFAYDEVFYNQLTQSYEFMKDGVLVAVIKSQL